MKMIGYILIAAGFLGGALVCVISKLEVNWTYFLIFLFIGIIGIVIVRQGQRQESLHQDKVDTNLRSIEESLQRIIESVKKIHGAFKPDGSIEIHTMIDEELPEALETFVDSRKTIAHIYGLQAYADVMNYFATGERYLNRVWSASADGYFDEAGEYIIKSEEQFSGALQELKKYKVN